jgi:ornithine cyclodeaminase/alanine dehydrogenase-like protein (mu-crystallin family)
MRIFDEAMTREALSFGPLIESLRKMFQAGCNVPARHVHRVQTEATDGTVLIMPAWTGKYLGIKTVNIYPANSSRGLPGLFSVYTLFDATTGQALAHMDGNVITSRRTAAASALAASYLARKNARSLLVIGAGRVGSLLPLAYSTIMDLQVVEIWDRSGTPAERLAASLCAQGIPAKAVLDLESAARRADIVSCATLATEPVVHGECLRSGTHCDLIGSFTPEMREADDAVFAGASLFVDTPEALLKSGDLLGPMSRGVLSASNVKGNLGELCSAQHPGRTYDDERTVFKSVGTALEDLAAAIAVFER